jgi:ribonuclease BN (tRNA processing enzyme)
MGGASWRSAKCAPWTRRRSVSGTLICEAVFCERDADHARYTGHLTARACGEIAAAAGVRQLIPFHFSPRYEGGAEDVYEEVAAACPATVGLRR